MRVPIYQRQVERQVTPHTPQTADAYGGVAATQIQTAGKALGTLADDLEPIERQRATTEAFNAEAQAKKDWIAYSADLQKNRQGVNAAGVTQDAEKWWDENKARYTAGKNGLASRMIDGSIKRMQLAAVEQFKGFELKQGEIAADAAAQANVSASVSAIAANPSEKNIALHRAGIDAALREHAAARGWAPEVLNDKLATAQSASTIAAFNTLLARNPKEARDFWNANRETVRGEHRDEIETRLKSAVAGSEAEDAVAGIWQTMGPKNDLAPVELDKMADAVRAKFKDQPEHLKAALQSLKERAGEHNSSQAERAAQTTNDVMAIWNSTKSLGTVKRSQAWAKLPPAQQTKVEEHINQQLYLAENRAYTAENRALTAANRDLVEMQKHQQRLRMEGFAAYLQYSDPKVLAGMSDAQVQALLPSLGNELTGDLVQKRRELNSPDKVKAASIDDDDFKTLAHEFKLKPYDNPKGEDAARLGALKSRVERLIGIAQQQKKGPLSREEKNDLMRREMAKQVLVNPGFFSSNKTMPVISLTPEEAARVVIPPSERPKLEEALRAKKLPINDANMKYLYLRGQSRAADLVVQ